MAVLLVLSYNSSPRVAASGETCKVQTPSEATVKRRPAEYEYPYNIQYADQILDLMTNLGNLLKPSVLRRKAIAMV